MNKLYKYIRDFVFRRTLRRMPEPKSVYIDYEHAHSVLLLFESDMLERNAQIRKIVKQMQDDGKYVAACGFVEKKPVQSAILPQFRILGQDDIDWFQRPLNDNVHDLFEQHFDLLLDLTTQSVRPLEYLMLQVDASLKVGRTELCGLRFAVPQDMLQEEEETEENNLQLAIKMLWKEYYKYLNAIKSV